MLKSAFSSLKRNVLILGSEKKKKEMDVPCSVWLSEWQIMIDRGLVPSESLFVFGRLLKATDNEVRTFRDKFFP